MLEEIARAEHEILVEMYIFADDATGRRFAEALAARARAGTEVRILYDAIGSLETSTSFWDELREAGCHVLEHNPVAFWRRRFRLDVLNRRDHRKILVVDRRVAFTGGMNFADPWAPTNEGGQGWRDDAVRVEGPAAEAMREVFVRSWLHAAHIGPASLPPPRCEVAPPVGDAQVFVLANHGLGVARAIRGEYLRRILRARRSIFITNSYFLPDAAIRRSLARRARGGVDVRVIVPGVSDVPAVRHASRALYESMMRDGVRIFERQGPVLHAKSAVVDGVWSTVGSYNLDYRSYRLNLEVVVGIEDARFGAVMERAFEDDLAESLEVDLQTFRRRPYLGRFLEQFFHLFRKLL
jgi:cardiolipin synthase